MDSEPIIYKTDISITTAGSVDSGKSTFVGVLTSGVLDNGNGSARYSVAKHPHELKSGKTSDIAMKHYLVPTKNRAITFIDLCGHEKYFKTTAHGVCGYYPDYSFMMISANRGILQMTKQHFTLLMAANIPQIILVTRPDITPRDIYEQTLTMIEKYLKAHLKIPGLLANNYYDDKIKISVEDIVKLLPKDQTKQIFIPIITISNKTGYGLDLVRTILDSIEPRDLWSNFDKNKICVNRVINGFLTHMDKKYFKHPDDKTLAVFYIDAVYTPPGVGLVVSGISRNCDLSVGDTIYIGPINKEFKEYRIRGIHNDYRQKVQKLQHHERGCIALAGDKEFSTRQYIKPGMFLIKNKKLIDTNVCYRFNAAITILNHSSTIKNNYTPLMQIGNVRQCARLIMDPQNNDGKDVISSKEYAYVTFKFKFKPALIEPYQLFIFKSGYIQGIGVVLDMVPCSNDDDAKPDPDKLVKVKYLKKNKIL
jgi:elongation factor 1-alpha